MLCVLLMSRDMDYTKASLLSVLPARLCAVRDHGWLVCRYLTDGKRENLEGGPGGGVE